MIARLEAKPCRPFTYVPPRAWPAVLTLILLVSPSAAAGSSRGDAGQHPDDRRTYEAAGAHFSVSFEGVADDAAARRMVEVLEQAYWDVGSALGVYPQERTRVILYTRQQFTSTTGSPDWAGAIYDGLIRIPGAGADRQPGDLRRTLVHEYVHAVVASVAGTQAPAWLNEGLATALEPGGLEWTSRVLGDTARRLRLDALEKSFAGLEAADVTLAYAQSAHAVKRLLDLRGAPAVRSLLEALGRGTPFAPAFQQHMFMSVDDLLRLVARD